MAKGGGAADSIKNNSVYYYYCVGFYADFFKKEKGKDFTFSREASTFSGRSCPYFEHCQVSTFGPPSKHMRSSF